jgi:hypothetical protein
VWLACPALLTAAHLHRSWVFFRAAAALTGTMGLLLAILMARAISVGLPPIPSVLTVEPEELPPGIIRFWRLASIGPTATSALLWNVWNRDYSDAARTVEDRSIARDVDREQLRRALDQLGAVPRGQQVPAAVDADFGRMAASLEARRGRLPAVLLQRARAMWFDEDTLHHAGWRTSHEAWLRPLRSALFVLTLLAPLLAWRHPSFRAIAAGTALLVVARTLFLVALTALEIRYVTPLMPVMELGACVAVMLWLKPGSPGSN